MATASQWTFSIATGTNIKEVFKVSLHLEIGEKRACDQVKHDERARRRPAKNK